MRPVNEELASAVPVRPATLRGREGFFRVAQAAGGRWTLLDPSGKPHFVKAVNGVTRMDVASDRPWTPDNAARLRRWGFNTAGMGGDGAICDDGFPFLATVNFCGAGPIIIAPGTRLPDVFAADWPQLAAKRAQEVCTPLSDTRELLGWVTDDAIGWAQSAASGRPTLLQICLSLEPAFAAYHAAWEFVLALHRGSLDAVARAWSVVLANKEVVRALTRAERGIVTRGYSRDDARWSREFARRYFATTAAAVRAVDPNHLIFGCRFDPSNSLPGGVTAGPNVLSECTYPAVDVAMPGWNELPPADGPGLQPVLAGDVCWMDETGVRALNRRRQPRLTTLERMLRRGRSALERMARHPSVVGYVWTRWLDEPGEQPPFARGLVHVNGVEAREHTELLAAFNARAESLRP